MRSAAQRQEDTEPEPDMAAVAAKAGAVLDAMLITAQQVTDTLNAWGTACPQDSRAVPFLQSMSTEIIGAGLHCEELRQEAARLAASLAALDAAFAAGRELERGQVRQEVPSPAPGRHAAARNRRLKVVRGLPVAAFAAAVGPAVRSLRQAASAHPAAMKPLALAAKGSWVGQHLAASGMIAGTALTATALLVPASPISPLGGGAAPTSLPAPAASVYSATPFPVASTGPSLIAGVTQRKGARTLGTGLPPSLLLPSYAPQDPSAPSGGGGGQDPSSQPASTPDVKLVVASSLDLGTGPSGTIRVTAYGGTVSWSATTSAAGLGLDSASGTLAAGDSATITVSIGADLQALTGPGSVTIDYGNGKQAVIPVSWTVVPLPVPSVVPTDVAPSALPTIAGV